MQQDDAKAFLGATQAEFQNLLEREIIEIIPVYLVLKGMKVLSSVWSMKRKPRVRTREVYTYKARLNFDGSQMQPGRDYNLTYALVASWESVRLLLALVLRNQWKTKQLDYVLAFPQAPVERECYMHVPKGIATMSIAPTTIFSTSLNRNSLF
jgi:Reverse transcriptase (RNA-dependent DNA polymerase)